MSPGRIEIVMIMMLLLTFYYYVMIPGLQKIAGIVLFWAGLLGGALFSALIYPLLAAFVGTGWMAMILTVLGGATMATGPFMIARLESRVNAAELRIKRLEGNANREVWQPPAEPPTGNSGFFGGLRKGIEEFKKAAREVEDEAQAKQTKKP